MASESIVENLFKEIDWIISRTKLIGINLKETSNISLRIRLKNEFNILIKRLVDIQEISLEIKKLSKEDVCLSALLVEKCERSKFKVHDSEGLFFT